MRMWGLALLPAAAGRQAGSGGQRALRTRDTPAGPLPGAAHASVHAIPWAGPSPFAEPAGERGAGRAPHLPEATTGGDDSPGFGPRPPALPAPPEWDPGSPGRTDSREGQPGHAGGQAVSVRSPHTSFKAYFCPFLGSGTVPTGVTPPTTAVVNPVSRLSSRRGRSIGPLPQDPVVCVFSIALFIFKSRSYFYFLFDLLLYAY